MPNCPRLLPGDAGFSFAQPNFFRSAAAGKWDVRLSGRAICSPGRGQNVVRPFINDGARRRNPSGPATIGADTMRTWRASLQFISTINAGPLIAYHVPRALDTSEFTGKHNGLTQQPPTRQNAESRLCHRNYKGRGHEKGRDMPRPAHISVNASCYRSFGYTML